MGKNKYITFDNYYDIDMYKRILSSGRNNHTKFEEFICLKPPFSRYLYVDTDDLPKFLDYDIATANYKKYLVSVVKPVRYEELYILERKKGKDKEVDNYINPYPFKDLHTKDYVCVFKSFDDSEVTNFSKILDNDIKIYKWGRSKLYKYNIYVCTNRYIKGIIPSNRILLEYDNKGINSKKSVPRNPGEIELDLNYRILVNEKLTDKQLHLVHFKNGTIYPLSIDSFIV